MEGYLQMKKIFKNKKTIISTGERSDDGETASIDDVEFYMTATGDILVGIWRVQEGVADIIEDEETGWDITLIKVENKKNTKIG